MRTVVLASELQAAQAENPSQTLEIVTAGQEGTLVKVDTAVNERDETRVEFVAPKKTLVIEDNVDIVPGSETALISTLVQNLLQASQDVLATLTTTNTLLLLTTGPKFDKIASKAISKMLSL